MKGLKYRFLFLGIIADLDQKSKSDNEKNTWYSYFQKGYLSYSPTKKTIVISWDKSEPLRLTSNFALKGRGMELSELVVFDGRLLTCEDRTGMIYEISGDKIFPWIILLDGNGRNTKGFKCEWATVKGETLYVGSMGKEWTTASGEFASYDPMFIKTINHFGQVNNTNNITTASKKFYFRLRMLIGQKSLKG